MSADVMPFSYEGTEIRVITDDQGRVLFCGRDVARNLGYANATKAIGDHCKGVPIRYPLPTPGGVQQTRFITEGDLYRLIAHSRLPTAQQFETWVFDEVLPTIRRHGAYATPDKIEEMLADPDTMIRTLQALKQEQERRRELETQQALDAPKVMFADAVSASKTSILVGELAKLITQAWADPSKVIGQNGLYEWLRQEGYLIKGNSRRDRNRPTQRAVDMGLFEVRERYSGGPEGTLLNFTTLVTGRGQQYFIRKALQGAIPWRGRLAA